jgi:hypothetical protein
VTREAVVEGFEQFVGDAIDESIKEFSIARALRSGVSGPGSAFVDRLLKNSRTVHRNIIEPELETYREMTFEQFGYVLDYAESDEGIGAFSDDILTSGAFENELRTDLSEERRTEVLSALLERYKKLGDAVVPLVKSPEEEFWAAAVAEIDRSEAETLVEEHFAFTRPVIEHRDAFKMTITISPGDIIGGIGGLLGGPGMLTVDYTDEGLRALQHAEDVVIESAKEEIDERFDA